MRAPRLWTLVALMACAVPSVGEAATAFEAGQPPLVVLIGSTGDESLLGRLSAELHALGMDIDRRVVAPDDAGVDLLVEAVLREGARAVVRVKTSAARIEVSIADPATHGVALREVLEGSPGSMAGPVLVVRSVEFVRAMLLGGPAPAPAATATDAPHSSATVITPVIPTEPVEPPLPAGPPAFGVTVVSGVAAAAGGLGAQAGIGGELRIRLGSMIGLELLGLAPLTTEPVPGPAKNVRAAIWLAGGGLHVRNPVGHTGAVELGAGALAVALRVAGDPGPGWKGTAQTGLGAAGYGRLGGEVGLTSLLAVRADVLVGGVFRRPVALAGGPPGNPWGYAFTTVLAGLEARWF